MKHVFYLLGLWCIALHSAAQNLVPNSSFESYTICPASTAQVNRCIGWISYTDASSDYFNTCNTGVVSVPVNILGSQAAAGGNAYVGIQDYSTSDYKEYVSTTIPALITGATYEVSMLVSLGDNAKYGSNGLGVFFFKDGPTNIPNFAKLLPVTPQVSYASYGPINSKTAWTKLKQRFVADSAFDHLVIGGFLNNSTVAYTTQSSGSFYYSYYYIDSVSVKYADTISLDVTGTSFCVGNTMQVKFDLNNAVQFTAGNVFTLQLSNSLGNFSTPLNIGTISGTNAGTINAVIPSGIISGAGYRVRIVSSSPVYTSPDNGINLGIGNSTPGPVAHITTPICEGDTFTLSVTSATTITEAIWNGPKYSNTNAASITSFSSTLADAGVYTVAVKNYGCGPVTASGALVINPSPAKPKGGSNGPVCSGDTLMLNGISAGSSDTWTTDSKSYNQKDVKIPSITLPDSGMYVLTTFLNGCKARDTIHVYVKERPLPAPMSNAPCTGDTLVISTAYSEVGATYDWNGPAGFHSSMQKNYLFNATQDVSGKYYLSVNALNGCMATDSITANVKPFPGHTSISGNNKFCEGDTISLAADNASSAVVFNWAGPFGFTGNGIEVMIPNAQLTASGTYTVKTNLDGCIVTDSTIVLVKHAPAIPDGYANTPLFLGQELLLNVSNKETGVDYKWSGPGGFSASAASVSISNVTKQNAGTYFITAMINGCSAGNIVLVTVDDKPDSSILVIYPNANDGDFTIKSSVKFEQQITISLFDDKGQLVYRSMAQTQNKMLNHSVKLHNALADGVYMLRLHIDGERVIARIVVRN